MARVEKLQIIGFRSFGAEEDPGPQKIDFVKREGASPLTLILGQNGCGKTTIIECLRYIATGDCPPGSYNGRSFVHDPKMAKQAVVTANVKLQFMGNDQDKYVVSRSMEATQKSKAITLKTLDSTISRRKTDGTTSVLSMKCGDINTQIFQALGVSRPILNYVIFCHQEESNWPLDEGSKLKDKFDEIFESAKYKDCLKNIKETRSHQMKLMSDLKKDIEYLGSDKKVATEKRRELKRKSEEREALEADMIVFDEELQPIVKEIREIVEVEINFSGIQEKITQAKTSLEHCRRETDDLEKSLDFVVPEETSDRQIEQMKDDLERDSRDKKSRIDELNRELNRAENEKRRCEFEVQKVTSNIGECKGLQTKYERDKRELKAILASAAKSLEWNPDTSFESESEVSDAVENICETVFVCENKFKSVSEEFELKIEAEAGKISKLEIQQAQLEEQKKIKTTERIKIKRDIANLKRELTDTDNSKSQLDDAEAQLQKVEAQISEILSQFDKTKSEEKSKQMKAKLLGLEKEEMSLKTERANLDSQREISSEIGIKNADKEDKEKRIERMMAKSLCEFSQVFQGDKVPKVSDLKVEYVKRFEGFSNGKRNAEKDIQKLRAEISSKKEQRRTLQQDISVKEERHRNFVRNIEDIVPNDKELEAELDHSKSEVDKARFELQAKEANKYTFQEFIERIEKMQDSRSKPHCPTCNRSFDKDSEATALIQDLNDEIKKIPGKVQSLQARLKRAEVRHDKLQALLPDKKQADLLKTEISEKKSQLSQLEKSTQSMEEQLTEKEEQLEVIDLDFNTCESLREDVLNIDRLHLEVSTLNSRIKELRDQCPELGDSRDYETVNSLLDEVSKRISTLREEFESHKDQENHFVQSINSLERKKNDFFSKKLEIERRFMERTKLETKKSELETLGIDIDKDLVLIDEKAKPLTSEIRDLASSKSKLLSDRDSQLHELRKKIEKVQKYQMQVQSMQKQVTDYEHSSNESTLKRLNLELEKLSSKRKRTENEFREADSERSNLEKELAGKSGQKRQLEDNLKLRSYKVRVREYEDEKQKYEERLERLDYSTVKRKKDNLLRLREAKERQKNEIKGRLSEMEVAIGSLQRELDTDKLKLAELRHREKTIEAKVRHAAIVDLNKYYMALDWAIMKFHKERMNQINMIIRELWKATYRGNDIDYIEIKTDDMESAAGADKRRVCNYKVVMCKNDTEMDMRGRCSAGQKVLASLIIRLALAETFSTSFGMIALDEPTTNLDRENIEALASALSELVVKRSIQRNFQLIVITHDEDLIDLLSKVDQVDHYYRVSRNDRGLSIIRKITTENR